MLIRNIYAYSENKDSRELKNAYVKDGQVEIFDLETPLLQQEKEAEEIIDAKEKYTLMPGMLDAHVHGQGGVDFSAVQDFTEDKGISVITKALGETGLSYAMATLVSLELSTLKKSLKAINAYVKKQEEEPTPGSTKIVGVHLEGPFIAKDCKGAHALSALQDSIDLATFREIISVAPDIKEWKITLAPDLPGAHQFIHDVKSLESEGISVKIFLGHTNPSIEDIEKAIALGVDGFTHLGNACQETCCRETRALAASDAKSRLVQWVLANPDRCPRGVELIVDGVHLSPSFVALIKNVIGNKIVLVTDALGPSGLQDGQYKLGTLNIYKLGNNFYLTDEEGKLIEKEGILPNGEKGPVKTLSGSAAPLSFCVHSYNKCLVDLHVDLVEEERMESLHAAIVTNPRLSSLSQNAIARLPDHKNFAIFDNEAELVMSLCNGRLMKHQKTICQPPQNIASGLLSNQGLISAGHTKSTKEQEVMPTVSAFNYFK